MKVKRGALVFKNVLGRTGEGDYNQWRSQIIELRNSVIKNNLYPTGPLFYNIQKSENGAYKYNIYIPVSNKLRIVNNDNYFFLEEFIIEDGLTLRHCGLEDNIDDTNEILIECALHNNIELEDEIYNIFVDVYGEKIVDVFIPVKKELK